MPPKVPPGQRYLLLIFIILQTLAGLYLVAVGVYSYGKQHTNLNLVVMATGIFAIITAGGGVLCVVKPMCLSVLSFVETSLLLLSGVVMLLLAFNKYLGGSSSSSFMWNNKALFMIGLGGLIIVSQLTICVLLSAALSARKSNSGNMKKTNNPNNYFPVAQEPTPYAEPVRMAKSVSQQRPSGLIEPAERVHEERYHVSEGHYEPPPSHDPYPSAPIIHEEVVTQHGPPSSGLLASPAEPELGRDTTTTTTSYDHIGHDDPQQEQLYHTEKPSFHQSYDEVYHSTEEARETHDDMVYEYQDDDEDHTELGIAPQDIVDTVGGDGSRRSGGGYASFGAASERSKSSDVAAAALAAAGQMKNPSFSNNRLEDVVENESHDYGYHGYPSGDYGGGFGADDAYEYPPNGGGDENRKKWGLAKQSFESNVSGAPSEY